MSRGTHTIENCKCLKESSKAILVVNAEDKEFWVPKSQVHDDSEVYKEDTDGRLVISSWWAEKEGIE